MKALKAALVAVANHLPRGPVGLTARRLVLRLAGVRLGAKVVIVGPLTIMPRGHTHGVSIGARSFLNTHTRFGARGGVRIGRFVQIGANVSFETGSHTLGFVPGRARADTTAPIRVGDHVWIGTGAVILPGVTIGRGAVVAAGAVVNRDVAAMTMVGGVPARFIRSVEELEQSEPPARQSARKLVAIAGVRSRDSH